MEIIEQYLFEIAAGAIMLLLVINAIVQSRRLASYKKLTKLLKGTSLEEHVCKLENQFKAQQDQIKDLASKVVSLKTELSAYPHCWHLMRYNAFDKTGSDLSFSLAVINDKADGFVLTSIFGREDSRVYAKPLSGGKSTYKLSEEESKTIEAALKQR